MENLWNQLRLSAAQYASQAAQSPVSPDGIRVPVRDGALGIYVGGPTADPLPPCPAGAALGAPLIASARYQGGWIIMELTGQFYSAAVEAVRLWLPPAPDDLHRHPLNRMLALARKGGSGCPDSAPVQRAMLTVLALADPCAPASPAHRLRQAERALEKMLLGVPPAKRPALADACGPMADAAARILYDFTTKHPIKGD